MEKIFTLLLVLQLSGLHAQFAEPVIINDQWTNLRSVFLEDINMDGHLDLFVFRNFDSHYYLNDGNGNFETPVDLDPDLNRPNYLECGDIDNDGDMDILVSSGQVGNFNRLLWLENDGNLNFSQNDIITTDGGLDDPFYCHLADLDNDGDLDAMVTSNGTNEMYITHNLGNGTFDTPLVITEEMGGPLKVNTLDINNDGLKEIFYINYFSGAERILYLSRNSDDTYDVNEVGVGLFANANSFQFVDIDFDNDLDIVTQWAGGGRFNWGDNLGNTGEFGDFEFMWSENSFDNGAPIGFFINQSNNTNELFFLTKKGYFYKITGTTGNFSEPVEVFFEEDNIFEFRLQKLAFGDINNDGSTDFVYLNETENLVKMRLGLESTPTQNITAEQIKVYPNPSQHTVFIDHPNVKNVKLTDLLGQVLIEVQDKNQLDVNQLANGFYNLTIQYNEQRITSAKIIVQK